MRLTLWQQFSSNHSANYTVIGVFDSAFEAREAGEKLQRMVVEIAKWSAEHRSTLWGEHWQPSPVEEQYAHEYHIDWKEPIDWLRPFRNFFVRHYQRQPDEYIIIFDQLVIVDAPGGSSTWQTGHQFANVLRALGGTTYSRIYDGANPDTQEQTFTSVSVDLTCNAPSEQVAEDIYQQIQTHLDSLEPPHYFHSWLLVPWVNYHPRYSYRTGDMPLAEFRRVEQIWIKEHQAWADYMQSVPQDQIDRERWKDFIKQDQALDSIIGSLKRDVNLSGKPICQYSGNTIRLIGLSHNIAEVLPALADWMQTQGCKVTYQFSQDGNVDGDSSDSGSSPRIAP